MTRVDPPSVDRLLTLGEAAARLSVSTRTLYRLIQDGQFPKPVRVGAGSRFFESDLILYLDRLRRGRER